MFCVRSILSQLKKSQVIINSVQRIINKSNYSQQMCHFSQDISQPEDETDTIIEDLCKGDSELEKKLRILMLEVEVMRQDGRHAPNYLRKHHWEHLLSLPSRNQRHNYLIYLWKTEMSKENQKAKKEARRKEREEDLPEETKEYPDDLLYGIKHQTLFLRIRDQSINNYDNSRALQAMMHGQSIVIDCSYEEHMIYREAVNAAKQMTFVFGDNRIHKNPFNIHMCNVNSKGPFMKQLRKNIPSLDESWFPLNISNKTYLDTFPKEKLVYLTPHCREELTTFDHDAVYIIGCMVDKVNNEPLSLAKAKRDGIKMAKLPLDRYLEWAPGSKKNLNINHMVPILLDLKLTNDWEYSLQHIPRRKLMETKILAMQKKLQGNPLLKQDLYKLFNKKSKLNSLSLKQKQLNSKRSLYDDENI